MIYAGYILGEVEEVTKFIVVYDGGWIVTRLQLSPRIVTKSKNLAFRRQNKIMDFTTGYLKNL